LRRSPVQSLLPKSWLIAPAERQAEAHAGSIGAALLERAEQLVHIALGKTKALVLDLGASVCTASSVMA
jgi:hypothetical protein